MIWDKTSLAEALGVKVDQSFTSGGAVQFNSKDVEPGDVFIALQGDNGNGHDYALSALNNGAACVILEHQIPGIPLEKAIIVQNTRVALVMLAEYKRAKSKATFIAITGSAGKTSTKEWLSTILQNFGKTTNSRSSFNNILGISLDLASMPDDAEYAVFEVGMNHSGEIRELISFITPDIALINNILPAHIGHFGSLQDIADAKLETFEYMNNCGIAVLNAGDEFYDYCAKKATELGVRKIFSFGDIEATQTANSLLVQYEFNGASKCAIEIDGTSVEFETKIGGRHRILNLASILLICKILGLDIQKVAGIFARLQEPKGRGNTHKIRYNEWNCALIDDSYNASPQTMIESLSHLEAIQHRHKVAILGDMKELGDKATEYHQNLILHILNASLDKVHTVGELMMHVHENLPENIRGMHFKDYLELEANFKNIVDRDMLLLFKASKGVKLWHAVDKLLSDQEGQSAV